MERIRGARRRPRAASKPRKRAKHPAWYPFELRLRAVRLHVQDGIPATHVAAELGVGICTLRSWIKTYLEEGEEALRPRRPRPKPRGNASKASAARKKAVEIKMQHPEYGSKRISQLLRRMFLLKASPETVRKALHEENLVAPPRKKPKKNPPKPRFFERSTPNQMWQTDIFTFRLGGKAAYLIGYIDDYSRYITGLGLFRSQTAEHVLEAYRCGIAEYGIPKEMLTDNGRQYTNWRGTTRFEAELKKDRIRHIKSRPHHPMTLGKIERFWKTIWTEFLGRAQFDSFEDAQKRVRLWVKYYNYKRPHQGIGGLCPADRFFEIQSELKKVLERGVEENVLEQALRGKPQSPFYLVGRMGDQSLSIRAEKGRVVMSLDGEELKDTKEVIYNLEKDDGAEKREDGTEDGAAPKEAGAEELSSAPGEGEVRGGPLGMDPEAEARGGVPGTGDQLGGLEPVAGQGHRGYDPGPGAETQRGAGAGGTAEPETPAVAGPEGLPAAEVEQAGETAHEHPDREAAGEGGTGGITDEQTEEVAGPEAGRCEGAGRSRPEGPERADHRHGGSPGVGDEPQELLQMGEACARGDGGGALRAELGPSGLGDRRGEGSNEEEDPGTGEGAEADEGRE